MKSCLYAIGRVFEERGSPVPVMASGTIFTGGRTLTGQTLEAFMIALEHFPMLSIGLNCAASQQMRPYLEVLNERARCQISCYPNAGMPDGMGRFDSNPNDFSDLMEQSTRPKKAG